MRCWLQKFAQQSDGRSFVGQAKKAKKEGAGDGEQEEVKPEDRLKITINTASLGSPMKRKQVHRPFSCCVCLSSRVMCTSAQGSRLRPIRLMSGTLTKRMNPDCFYPVLVNFVHFYQPRVCRGNTYLTDML